MCILIYWTLKLALFKWDVEYLIKISQEIIKTIKCNSFQLCCWFVIVWRCSFLLSNQKLTTTTITGNKDENKWEQVVFYYKHLILYKFSAFLWASWCEPLSFESVKKLFLTSIIKTFDGCDSKSVESHWLTLKVKPQSLAIIR